MADAFRPITLFFGALCLWALMLALLAWSGLGGRYEEAPDDPTQVKRLPSFTLARSASRLGPLTQYKEVGERPLTMADRRPAPVEAVENADALDVALTSVLITPALQLAIFTDNQGGATRRVKVGDTVAGSGWRLVQLEPRRAVLEGPSGQRSLDLRVFDGKGGVPPTVVSATMPSPAVLPGAQPPLPVASPSPPNQTPMPNPAMPRQNANSPDVPLTHEQQIEAIRRRIEARRAQMRAEAAERDESDKR